MMIHATRSLSPDIKSRGGRLPDLRPRVSTVSAWTYWKTRAFPVGCSGRGRGRSTVRILPSPERMICGSLGSWGWLGFGSSVFFRQHDAGRRPVPLGDDEDLVTLRQPVTAQYAAAMKQCVFVGLSVLVREIAPISAVVAEQIAGQINVERDCSGSGDGSP